MKRPFPHEKVLSKVQDLNYRLNNYVSNLGGFVTTSTYDNVIRRLNKLSEQLEVHAGEFEPSQAPTFTESELKDFQRWLGYKVDY